MSEITEEIKNWDKILQDYEEQLRLPPYKAPGHETELEEYLSMDRESLLKLDREHRAAISYRLQQFSFYLRRTINRNTSRLGRLKRVLSVYAAGGRLANYAAQNRYMTYEEKLDCLCKDDSYAASLSSCIVQFQERVDRLKDLDRSLDSLALAMRNMSYLGGSDGKKD